MNPDTKSGLGAHSAARDLDESLLKHGIGYAPVPAAQRHVAAKGAPPFRGRPQPHKALHSLCARSKVQRT